MKTHKKGIDSDARYSNSQSAGARCHRQAADAGETIVRRYAGSLAEPAARQEAEAVRALRRQAREDIIGVFKVIMKSTPSAGYLWRGTLTDLMELTHIAWLSGAFTDGAGRMVTFRDMAAHVCEVLHRTMRTRPYNLVRNAGLRLGIRSGSVFDRYVLLMMQGTKNPMLLDIGFVF